MERTKPVYRALFNTNRHNLWPVPCFMERLNPTQHIEECLHHIIDLSLRIQKKNKRESYLTTQLLQFVVSSNIDIVNYGIRHTPWLKTLDGIISHGTTYSNSTYRGMHYPKQLIYQLDPKKKKKHIIGGGWYTGWIQESRWNNINNLRSPYKKSR